MEDRYQRAARHERVILAAIKENPDLLDREIADAMDLDMIILPDRVGKVRRKYNIPRPVKQSAIDVITPLCHLDTRIIMEKTGYGQTVINNVKRRLNNKSVAQYNHNKDWLYNTDFKQFEVSSRLLMQPMSKMGQVYMEIANER